jgi:uncharacterized membrane protein YfcA
MTWLISWTSLAGLVIGFASGVLAALVGIGGAVITTPMLRVLGATPLQAVGSTVPAILPGAVAGSLRYHREGYIRWRAAGVIAAAGLPAAIGGALLADVIDAGWLMVITALLVIWSAGAMLRHARRERRATQPPASTTDTSPHEQPATDRRGAAPDHSDPQTLKLFLIGLVAGFLAGVLGVGGGIVVTPALNLWVKFGAKEAVATSLAAVAAMSTSALVSHIALGHVAWQFALPLVIGIVPGARVGSRITVGASEARVRAMTGWFFLALGLVYLVRELAPLV